MVRSINRSVLKKAPEEEKITFSDRYVLLPFAPLCFLLCFVWYPKDFSPGCKWISLLGVAVATKLEGGFSK